MPAPATPALAEWQQQFDSSNARLEGFKMKMSHASPNALRRAALKAQAQAQASAPSPVEALRAAHHRKRGSPGGTKGPGGSRFQDDPSRAAASVAQPVLREYQGTGHRTDGSHAATALHAALEQPVFHGPAEVVKGAGHHSTPASRAAAAAWSAAPQPERADRHPHQHPHGRRAPPGAAAGRTAASPPSPPSGAAEASLRRALDLAQGEVSALRGERDTLVAERRAWTARLDSESDMLTDLLADARRTKAVALDEIRRAAAERDLNGPRDAEAGRSKVGAKLAATPLGGEGATSDGAELHETLAARVRSLCAHHAATEAAALDAVYAAEAAFLAGTDAARHVGEVATLAAYADLTAHHRKAGAKLTVAGDTLDLSVEQLRERTLALSLLDASPAVAGLAPLADPARDARVRDRRERVDLEAKNAALKANLAQLRARTIAARIGAGEAAAGPALALSPASVPEGARAAFAAARATAAEAEIRGRAAASAGAWAELPPALAAAAEAVARDAVAQEMRQHPRARDVPPPAAAAVADMAVDALKPSLGGVLLPLCRNEVVRNQGPEGLAVFAANVVRSDDIQVELVPTVNMLVMYAAVRHKQNGLGRKLGGGGGGAEGAE